jgi:hypothetical protein
VPKQTVSGLSGKALGGKDRGLGRQWEISSHHGVNRQARWLSFFSVGKLGKR